VTSDPEAERRTFTENARRRQIVDAAIDTIAELGYGQASLARIATRIGISKGVISYHFAGKDDLIKQIVIDVVEAGRAYILPRVFAESTGPAVAGASSPHAARVACDADRAVKALGHTSTRCC
jgi:TetR/AcrR family fatty acid metabolism transcriptional regulator